MGIWKMSQLKAPPRTENVQELREYINYFSNQIAIMLKDLDFTLNGDINFNNVKANGIETKNLKAGAVTADKITVTELSAISADLGHITAGLIESIEIFSSYFGTRNGEFPLCEIDSATNRIRSAYSETNYISLEPGFGGFPALYMTTELNDTSLSSDGEKARLQTIRDLIIGSNIGDIRIALDFGSMLFDGFNQIYDQSTAENLQQKLDNLSTSIGSLATSYSSLESRVTALETP